MRTSFFDPIARTRSLFGFVLASVLFAILASYSVTGFRKELSLNPDSAVEMDTCTPIERRAWRSEDIEANNLSAVYGVWSNAGKLSASRLQNWSLQAVTSRWPIVFAPEGLPLGRWVSLNCRIGVESRSR
jgi:hypothetical protein